MRLKGGARFGVLDVVTLLILFYLLFPLFVIILYSFNPTSSLQFPLDGFSLRWYREVVKDKIIIASLRHSFYVALAVSIISVILGTLASFALTRYNFRFKNFVSFSVIIPITLPAIILGISLLSFFSAIDFTRSLLTVIFGHCIFCIPFAVLVMNSRLSRFDASVEEAAKDLGATSIQTFRYITFPLIRPSIIGVMMLTFALSFDEFLVSFFVIGRKNTLPLVIWGMLRRGVSPTINAVATMVLVFSITLIVLANKYAKIRTLR